MIMGTLWFEDIMIWRHYDYGDIMIWGHYDLETSIDFGI